MPTAAKKTAASSPPPSAPPGSPDAGGAAPVQNSLTRHLAVVSEASVMSPTELYEFLESLRALTTGIAFAASSAGTQLERAASQGAREQGDGRLTLAQKLQLRLVLRKMGSQMSRSIPEDLLVAATRAVKTYSLLQAFLDDVESSTVDRPHRRSRGGFSL